MDQQELNRRYFSGPIYRLLSGLFGSFLIAVGVYAIFFGVVGPFVRIAFGLSVALVGGEAVWSAIQSKQSWLVRLGPFF